MFLGFSAAAAVAAALLPIETKGRDLPEDVDAAGAATGGSGKAGAAPPPAGEVQLHVQSSEENPFHTDSVTSQSIGMSKS